jgi:hypothetical protein
MMAVINITAIIFNLLCHSRRDTAFGTACEERSSATKQSPGRNQFRDYIKSEIASAKTASQ